MPVKIEASPVGEPAASEDFFEAIMAGNSKAAADALLRMDGLSLIDRERLADLISGEPVSANCYPYRFKLVPNRGRGRPSDKLKKQAGQFGVVRAVELAYKDSGSVESAVATIKDRAKKVGAKWGRSKTFDARRAIKNKCRPSSRMTKMEQQVAPAIEPGEPQLAEFVQDKGQMMSESALPAADEIEHIAKPPTSAGTDAASSVGEMGASPAEQDGVAFPDDANKPEGREDLGER
jgi:hypothetical protein